MLDNKNNVKPKIDKYGLIFGGVAVILMIILIIVLILWNTINNNTIVWILFGIFMSLLVIDIIGYIVYMFIKEKKQKENE